MNFQSFCSLPLTHLKGREVEVECSYPSKVGANWSWSKETGILTVQHPVVNCARLYTIKY